jgi:hypothetical protein
LPDCIIVLVSAARIAVGGFLWCNGARSICMDVENGLSGRWRMWRCLERDYWMKILLIVICLSIAACSTQRAQPKDETAINTDDPFNDPFFTQPPPWDDSVLQQSEVLTGMDGEPEKPKTFLEQSEGVMLSTLIVGATLGKMALPFLGLGF